MTASLCFLSFERPEFLRTAIDTALAGVDEPVELIVHDDGSTNRDLLKYLYTIHQRGEVSSLILNAPGCNQGQGVALNRMFKMAIGDIIIKLDQDLIFQPGWLARVREILADDRVGLLGFFKYWHDPVNWQQTIITDTHLLAGDFRKDAVGAVRPMDQADLPRGYSFHTHICGSAFAIRRDIWEDFGPFQERWTSFGEDWQFQKDIHDHPSFFNALPDDDLVANQGFGVGPSTVVVANPDTGQPEPRSICKYPVLVGGR
jgi:glycosyltransferase involved in cell wall biosynthesis